MVDGFEGLGHDPVVGGDDEHGDVRYPSAPGAHGGESLVSGGVQEGHDGPIVVDLVCADVLGNSPGLALYDVSVADGVQEGCLAVVDVAEYRDNRRARLKGVLVLFVFGGEDQGGRA